MSDDRGLTVGQLLPERFDRIGELVDRKLRDTREAKRFGIPSFVWDRLDAPVSAAIHDALDRNVLEMLAEGWSSARELREVAKATRRPPGARAEWVLGKHTVTTSVHPVLQIAVPGGRYDALRFTLELSAEINAVQLSIAGGHITAATGIECTLVAQLKYGDAKLHAPQKSRKFRPLGEYTFPAPGIAIPVTAK